MQRRFLQLADVCVAMRLLASGSVLETIRSGCRLRYQRGKSPEKGFQSTYETYVATRLLIVKFKGFDTEMFRNKLPVIIVIRHAVISIFSKICVTNAAIFWERDVFRDEVDYLTDDTLCLG